MLIAILPSVDSLRSAAGGMISMMLALRFQCEFFTNGLAAKNNYSIIVVKE